MKYVVWVAKSFIEDKDYGTLLIIGSCREDVLKHVISFHTNEHVELEQQFVLRREVPDYDSAESMKQMLKDLTKDFHVYDGAYVRDTEEVRKILKADSAKEFADIMCDWVLNQSRKIRGGDAQ